MPRPVALERRLSRRPGILTLGVKPNFSDYSPQEASRILDAPTIYFPSRFYVHLFQAMGKRTFPGPATYAFAQDKIRQTALFQMLGIPHPRTRIYYGARQQEEILKDFTFPFVAKVARGSACGRGVHLVQNREDLALYCRENHAAYIQELLPIDRDLRVVVIGGEVALAYWRLPPEGGFLNNISAGGAISFEPVPGQLLDLAVKTAVRCGWDDVGLDLCLAGGEPLVIEANMKYGRRGFAMAGLDYQELMEKLITHGKI